MSTKYGGSLGGLALALLIAISLGCPLRAAARPVGALAPDAVVAIDPPQVAVDAQETFSVAVTIADVSELRSYEFTLTYDPAVVEVEAVEGGGFLEGKSPIWLGPAIDNGTGTVTFGALSMGSAPWPSGAGELATIRLKAVGDGFTALHLEDVDLFDSDLNEIEAVAEDGEVQVGEGEVPTHTATGEPAASDTPTATSAATATEAATSPSEATATKTPTDGATAAPGATATEATEAATSPPGASATGTGPPTEAGTSPPGATATQPPTAGGTADATSTAQPGPPPEAAEGSPSATAQPVEGGGATVEPGATSTDEAPGGGTPSGSTWLIVAAALLGLAGVALIGVGVFALGLRRRTGEEPMDDDS